MRDREVRAGQPAEVRADAEGVKVEGYAAVFNDGAMIGDYFKELIHPGAFANALKRGEDVPFVIEHAGLPLARTSSGTLTLAEDAHGLKMASALDPQDPDVMRIVPKMKRGDLSKMSFAFRAVRQEWDETGPVMTRHLYEVELYDVSIVTTPAYDGTEIALRSRPLVVVAPPALVGRVERDLALRSRLLRA
jgi:HK97 family phage prohead protease